MNCRPKELESLFAVLQEYDCQRQFVVYFLISDGVVVYAGQSVGLKSRVDWHRKMFYEFDHVMFFDVPAEDVDAIEQDWIARLRPIYNTRGTGRKYGHISRLRSLERGAG